MGVGEYENIYAQGHTQGHTQGHAIHVYACPAGGGARTQADLLLYVLDVLGTLHHWSTGDTGMGRVEADG